MTEMQVTPTKGHVMHACVGEAKVTRGRVALLKAVAVPLLILVFVAGCATMERHDYAELYDGMKSFAMFSDGDEYAPMQVVSKEDATPLAGVTVRLRWNGGETSMVTDERGVFMLPLTDDLRRLNPLIRPDRPCSMRSFGTMRGARMEGSAPRPVSTEGKKRLESGDLIVLYDDGQEALASNVMGAMQRQAAVVEDVTGLRPVAWGVVIVKDAEGGHAALVRSTKYGRQIWAYTEKECASDEWAIANVHEWTEFTMGDRLQLYGDSDGGRFMRDGIAEYAAYRWNGRYTRGSSLKVLLESGTTKVNLLQDFTNPSVAGMAELPGALDKHFFAPGYPMSFVFWEEMSRQCGRDFAKRFLAEFSKCRPKSPESAVGTLEKLSGRRDLTKRLTEADVAQAMKVIQSMARGVP